MNITKSNLLRFRLVALAAAALLLVSIAGGADIHVPKDDASLQNAVDAASSGDTILIAPGVHAGQTLIIGKDLTLVGGPGTVLRATSTKSGFEGSPNVPVLGILRSQVDLRGITFEGGHDGIKICTPTIPNR